MSKNVLLRFSRPANGGIVFVDPESVFMEVDKDGKPSACYYNEEDCKFELDIDMYTGHADTNGRKIFSGDLLECKNKKSGIVETVFIAGAYFAYLKTHPETVFNFSQLLDMYSVVSWPKGDSLL